MKILPPNQTPVLPLEAPSTKDQTSEKQTIFRFSDVETWTLLQNGRQFPREPFSVIDIHGYSFLVQGSQSKEDLQIIKNSLESAYHPNYFHLPAFGAVTPDGFEKPLVFHVTQKSTFQAEIQRGNSGQDVLPNIDHLLGLYEGDRDQIWVRNDSPDSGETAVHEFTHAFSDYFVTQTSSEGVEYGNIIQDKFRKNLHRHWANQLEKAGLSEDDVEKYYQAQLTLLENKGEKSVASLKKTREATHQIKDFHEKASKTFVSTYAATAYYDGCFDLEEGVQGAKTVGRQIMQTQPSHLHPTIKGKEEKWPPAAGDFVLPDQSIDRIPSGDPKKGTPDILKEFWAESWVAYKTDPKKLYDVDADLYWAIRAFDEEMIAATPNQVVNGEAMHASMQTFQRVIINPQTFPCWQSTYPL